jgi:hypothetical protein
MRNLITLAVAILLLPAPAPGAQTGSIPDPHMHANLGDSMLGDIAPDVDIREVEDAPLPAKGKGVLNPERTMRAFTLSYKDAAVEQLLVEDLGSHEVYLIDGLPFPNRPFSDIVWAKGDLLVFDRWTNPHMGVHYVADMKAKKLVVAALLADER